MEGEERSRKRHGQEDGGEVGGSCKAGPLIRGGVLRHAGRDENVSFD